RPAGGEAFAVGERHPGLPVPGRPGRWLVAAGGRCRPDRATGAAAGRPSRFLNMLRVAKPTSPMSVGTWILSAYGPAAGLAGAAELAPAIANRLPMLARSLSWVSRPVGLA